MMILQKTFGKEIGDFKKSEARKKLQSLYPELSFIFLNQVHGKTIIQPEQNHLVEADGVISTQKNQALAILHADCQAALFYDPKLQIIAAVHAGWRGLVQNIYKEAVQNLCLCGSKAENIHCTITPSLGVLHSEFKTYREIFPEAFYPFRREGDLFDLKAVAKQQLMELGLQEENITISPLCTFEEEGRFHSYRRDKTTERNLSFIALVSEEKNRV